MISERVDHYEIAERIGAGGMGVVYRAQDTRLERTVALKILPPDASGDGRRRFLQEARAASALNHPNIVTIYDIGESGNLAYIAMEHVDGCTLGEWIAAGGYTVAEALVFARQTAGAVAQAHEAGILHRDLKPSNLMVTSEGIVKVLDFGLAKRLPPERTTAGEAALTLSLSAETRPGVITGTPEYMSPEQAQGRALDARSDIFSFGAVLYEMLTGHSPFARDSRVGTLAAVLHDRPAPASRLNPEVPRKLDRIAARCLEKDPARRYRSMREVSAALAAVNTRTSLAAMWGRFAAAMVLLILAAVAFPVARNQYRLWRAHRELPRQLHVAVLPFQNVGADPANQAFCEGLADTLSNALMRMQQFHPSLTVVPAGEVRNRATATAEAARRNLGANLVISGSVRRTAGAVRLTANLVDTGSSAKIAAWSGSAPVSELSNLMDRAVEQTAGLLNLAMAQQERSTLARERTSSGSAYDLYVQARGALQRYDKPGNIENAISLLRDAIARDPRFAAAYASLSEAHWRRYRESKNLRDLDEARDLGLRATEIDDRIAAAHANLGTVFAATGDSQSAARQYERALQLDPVNSVAHRGLAQALAAQSRFEEAEAAYRKAVTLRPDDWITLTSFGTFLNNRGRYREAEEAFAKVTRMTPDNAIALGNLASVHLSLREYDRAAEGAARAIAIQPKPAASAYLMLANVRFEQGRYREAALWNEKASDLAAGKSYTILGNLADSYRWTPELAGKAPETYRLARDVASRAVATNPRNGYALSCRALYSAKLGERAAAERDIRKALELAPKDVRVVVNSVTVFELVRQRPRALAQLALAAKSGYPETTILQDPELQSLRGSARN